jgi:hypothetical protein
MFKANLRTRILQLFVLALLVAPVSALAGSAVVGSVAGSMNATIGGQALVPNTTVFSGDSLQVKDGAAVVAVGQGSRLVFGRDTSASFLREAEEVTVLLGRGNVSMYHADGRVAVQVKVGEISVMPAKGYKTLGEIAMLNGSLVVTAKEGLLKVTDGVKTVEVAKGKTISVTPKAPARTPAPAGGGSSSASTALAAAAVGTGGGSLVTSAVALSRAGDARDAAAAANATAAQAVQAANNATAAAEDATAAAEAAEATANAVGCALDQVALELDPALSPFQAGGGVCP